MNREGLEVFPCLSLVHPFCHRHVFIKLQGGFIFLKNGANGFVAKKKLAL